MPSHKTLSTWYFQLAQQLEAGALLSEAFRSSTNSGLPRRDLLAMAEKCERGGSIDDALGVSIRWMPEADRLFLSAAAAAGRLPRVLRSLSNRHEQLHRLFFRLVLACAYPLAVLQLGLLLFPLLTMIDWETGFVWDARAYVRALVAAAGPLWFFAIVLLVLIRRQSPILARAAHALPFFRRFAKAQALADLAFALGNFLEAGLRIDHAWQAAGVITRSSELRAAALAIDAVIARGERPAAHLGNWRCFPSDFTAHYCQGETTGQLEQSLLHLSTRYQSEANFALGIASLLYPGFLLLLVLGVIGYHIVAFYGGYLKMLTELTAQ